MSNPNVTFLFSKILSNPDHRNRLMHDDPLALHVVIGLGRLPLGDLADEQVVWSWSGSGADAKEGIERGMPCPASIEAEHELVEVVLEVGLSQSVVNAQAPALEIGEQAMDPGQHDMRCHRTEWRPRRPLLDPGRC